MDMADYREWVRDQDLGDWCSVAWDRAAGFDISPACRFHDYCYTGRPGYSRIRSDLILLKLIVRYSRRQAFNMTDFNVQVFLRWISYLTYSVRVTKGVIVAVFYFLFVLIFGSCHFEGGD